MDTLTEGDTGTTKWRPQNAFGVLRLAKKQYLHLETRKGSVRSRTRQNLRYTDIIIEEIVTKLWHTHIIRNFIQ